MHQGVSTPLWWIHWGVDFFVYIEQVSEQLYKKTSWWIILVDIPSVLITGESWLPVVFCTSIVLSLTSLGQLPSGEYTGESQLHSDEYTREPKLSGYEYTEESITNMNNSSNIRQNPKSFLGVSNGLMGLGEVMLMKKTRVNKSCIYIYIYIYIYQLHLEIQ
jgi:hypothetical protein